MPEAAEFDLPRIVDQMEILLCLWSETPLPRESDQVRQLAHDLADTVRMRTMATDTAGKTKPPGKLGAEKLTPEEQPRRFEELAREAGCDETSEARFDEALQVMARPKPKN